jgi:hypothetical protein
MDSLFMTPGNFCQFSIPTPPSLPSPLLRVWYYRHKIVDLLPPLDRDVTNEKRSKDVNKYLWRHLWTKNILNAGRLKIQQTNQLRRKMSRRRSLWKLKTFFSKNKVVLHFIFDEIGSQSYININRVSYRLLDW